MNAWHAGQDLILLLIGGSAPHAIPKTTAVKAALYQKGKKKKVLEINFQNGRYSVLWNGTDLSAEILSVICGEFKPGVMPEVMLIVHPEQMVMNLDTKYVKVKVPSGKTQQAQASPHPNPCSSNICIVRSDGSCLSTSGSCTS